MGRPKGSKNSKDVESEGGFGANPEITEAPEITEVPEQTTSVATEVMPSNIQFFGEVDRDARGGIKNNYPAWMLPRQLDEMREEVAKKKRALDRGELHGEQAMLAREEVKQLDERIAIIEDSRPNLSGRAKDYIYSKYNELGERIQESMYSYDDMHYGDGRGGADAHKEAERMTKPCIEVDPDIARECGLSVDAKGMLSRNQASKVWKILGASLGENTNTERLRRVGGESKRNFTGWTPARG